MKLRFRDARADGRTNGDIEALADAMRALKNFLPFDWWFDMAIVARLS